MSDCKHNFEQSTTMDGHGILSRSTCPKCIIERQAKRIKELEETDRKLRHELCDLREGHRITDDQIDALWELMWRNPEQGYRALKLIGIVRCESKWCNNGQVRAVEGVTTKGRCDLPCPDCDGHGWVVRDE